MSLPRAFRGMDVTGGIAVSVECGASIAILIGNAPRGQRNGNVSLVRFPFVVNGTRPILYIIGMNWKRSMIDCWWRESISGAI